MIRFGMTRSFTFEKDIGIVRREQKSQVVFLIKKRKSAMFRLWAKEWKENRMIRDTVIEDDRPDTRTHKVFHALEEVCFQFDLGKPIWLDATIQEFKKHDKARFTQDSFIETIDFDYLEIQVIEED